MKCEPNRLAHMMKVYSRNKGCKKQIGPNITDGPSKNETTMSKRRPAAYWGIVTNIHQ